MLDFLQIVDAYEFLSLSENWPEINGHWERVPEAIVANESFGRSMQMVLDDMLKLVYAYDLSYGYSELKGGESLVQAFNLMDKYELLKDSPAPFNTVYVSPLFLLGIGTGIPKKLGDAMISGSALKSPEFLALRTSLGSSLSGTSADWKLFDPSLAGLEVEEAIEDVVWSDEEWVAHLKACYVRLLFHCAMKLIELAGLNARELPV